MYELQRKEKKEFRSTTYHTFANNTTVSNLIAGKDALYADKARIDRSPTELRSCAVDSFQVDTEVRRNVQRYWTRISYKR